MMKKGWNLGGLVLLALLSVVVWLRMPVATAANTGVLVGDRLPAFYVTNRDGEAFEISPDGKPIVLNFWATWCPPCRAELPELAGFAREYEGAVQFYGINLKEAPQTVEAFLEQQQVVLPVAYDRSGEVARLFAIRYIPTTIIADGQGIITFRKSGPVTAAELADALKK